MSVQLQEFSKDSLKAAREHWINQACESDLPTTEYEMVFEWAKTRIVYKSRTSDSYAYGIINTATQECCAVVDIVYRQQGADGWLKMLSVHLSPAFATSELERDVSKLEKVLEIYVESAIGTIALTGSHKAKKIKLYGRNDPMLNLLLAMKERLKQAGGPFSDVTMEGRWLSLPLNLENLK